MSEICVSQCTNGSNGAIEAISKAKQDLQHLLLKHDGDTTHPDAKVAMDHLIALGEANRASKTPSSNQTDDDEAVEWSPAQDAELIKGRRRSICTPPFPGRLPNLPEEDGVNVEGNVKESRYTLGRMSFGMYQPKNLVCNLRETVNIIFPMASRTKDDDSGKNANGSNIGEAMSYNNVCQIDIIAPVPSSSGESTVKKATKRIPAKLINFAVCTPQSPTTLGVTFTGGTLRPDFEPSTDPTGQRKEDEVIKEGEELIDLWKHLFENKNDGASDSSSPYGEDHPFSQHLQKENTFVRRLSNTFQEGALKFILGLESVDNAVIDLDDGSTAKEGDSSEALSQPDVPESKEFQELRRSYLDLVRNHSQSYTMKRPIKGHSEILFLDDSMRVTLGNLGTYVVVERI